MFFLFVPLFYVTVFGHKRHQLSGILSLCEILELLCGLENIIRASINIGVMSMPLPFKQNPRIQCLKANQTIAASRCLCQKQMDMTTMQTDHKDGLHTPQTNILDGVQLIHYGFKLLCKQLSNSINPKCLAILNLLLMTAETIINVPSRSWISIKWHDVQG